MSAHDRPLTLDQLAAVKDEHIDFSDIPELDEAFWKRAELIEPDRTEQITLRVKRSVLAYFRASGKATRRASTMCSEATCGRTPGVALQVTRWTSRALQPTPGSLEPAGRIDAARGQKAHPGAAVGTGHPVSVPDMAS